MTGKWHSIIRISRPDPDQVAAEVTVDTDSPWFSGHFPGRPILPGIAQIGMVQDVIGQFGDSELGIAELKKVRFKQMIEPNEVVTLLVRRRGKGPASYSFRIMVKDKVACGGILIAAK